MKDAEALLTQKEAIYRLVVDTLGDQLRVGMDARELLYGANRKHYGRRVYDSEKLDLIRSRIADGMRVGRIACRKRRTWLDEGVKLVKSYSGMRKSDPFDEYANRIMHYWLANDSRMNGRGKHRPGFKDMVSRYYRLRNKDEGLKLIGGLMGSTKSAEKYETLKYHAANRRLHIFLEAAGIRIEDLPIELQQELGLLKFKEEKTA